MSVTNGLFTTAIEFGPGMFTGGSNWLQIAVRTNGSGSFTTLTPRQQVTPVPYALTAGSANNLADMSVQPNVSSGAPNLIGGSLNNFVTSGVIGATIGGGYNNSIQTNAQYSFLGGGQGNTNTGSYAVIPGGNHNVAGAYSFAAGNYAQATNTGVFVWGDVSVSTPVSSTNANSWTVRASGGVRFFSNSGMTAGVILAPGGGSFANLSDRNAKEAFAPVNAQTVLAGVAALPLSTWKYKSQDASIRHIGPMAQDFKAAFGVGENDTGITTVDEDGVALAAIQGLNQQLENEAKAKDAEIESLKARLEKLEQVINVKTGGGQ